MQDFAPLFEALTGNRPFPWQAALYRRFLPPPIIVATPPAAIQPRYGFKTFVPDNVGDLVAKSWSGGKDNYIVFDKPVTGPLCIGGGRFLGLGLFAAVPVGGAGARA